MARKRHDISQLQHAIRHGERMRAPTLANEFPDVKDLVIEMVFTNVPAPPSPRKYFFNPASHAYFEFPCPSSECVSGGGYDLSSVVRDMLGRRKPEMKGEMRCEGEKKDRKGPLGTIKSPCWLTMQYRVTARYKE